MVGQQNVVAFFRLVSRDPHLADKVRQIPDASDAPGRLIELAASLGLPFSVKDLHGSRVLTDAEFHHSAGDHIRKWL